MTKKIIALTLCWFLLTITYGQEKTTKKESPSSRCDPGGLKWEMLTESHSQKPIDKLYKHPAYTMFPIHINLNAGLSHEPLAKEIPSQISTRTKALQSSLFDTLLVEGFEKAFPSAPWIVFDGDGTSYGEYYWAKSNYKIHSGNYSAWCVRGGANGRNLPNGSNYPSNVSSHMIYGPIDLSDVNYAAISFFVWLNTENKYDIFSINASVNGINFYGFGYSGSSQGYWAPITFSLKNVPTLGDITGQNAVWFSFVFTSDATTQYEGVYLDDIVVVKAMLDTMTVVNSFASPGPSPWGLTYDGTNLWNSDDANDRVYQLSTTGTVLSSFSSPEQSPGGMAWDSSNLWLADDKSDRVYKLTSSGSIISSFSTPGPLPTGLTWDGTSLWLSDLSVNTIWKLTTTGQIVTSFSAPGNDHSGLSWKSGHLYLTDMETCLIYEMDTTGTILDCYLAPAGLPTDLEWDGTYYWLADFENEKIYQLKAPIPAQNPKAFFTVSPASGGIETLFTVDASGSSDIQTPSAQLEVRWDWENDGSYDTAWKATKTNSHQYPLAGYYTIKLEAKDADGNTDFATNNVSVAASLPWSENFLSTTLDPSKWPYNNGPAQINAMGANEPSPVYSLNLNGTDEVRSQTIDLAGRTNVILSYYYEMGGDGDAAEIGNDLWIDYSNSSGTWTNLQRHKGGGQKMSSYSFVKVTLALDAYHQSFAIRLRTTGDANTDDWFIDDVSISDVANAVDEEGGEKLPISYVLSQNYPNPFNPETFIAYQLPKQAEVRLEIYNIVGELVNTLVSESQPAGYYTVRWNGNDENGNPVASGVYLYSLRAEKFVQVRKMILVR